MAGLGRRSHYRKHLTDAVLHDLPEPDESLGQRIARVVGTRGGNMFDVIVAPLSASLKTGGDKTLETESKGGASIIADENREADKSDKNGNRAKTTSAPENEGETNEADNNNIQQGTITHLTPQLAFLPTKFRKLVWIKRNDFVIVDCGEEEVQEEPTTLEQQPKEETTSNSGGGGGFRYVISHILYKDQVKHIKSKGLWPSDPFFADEEAQSATVPDVKSMVLEQKNIESCREKDVGGGGGGGGDDDGSENNDEDYEEYEDNGYGAQGGYDENGIVFDDPLGDEFLVNTNRIATLRVDDSSSDDSDDE